MQNWRNSYDAQKSRLITNNPRGVGYPAFLVKYVSQKNQINQNTDLSNSFKKLIPSQKSPFRTKQYSKSPLKITNERVSVPKSPKQAIRSKNVSQQPQEISQIPHKSSVITQDSQNSNIETKKMTPIERCVSNLRDQKRSPFNIKNNKKQKFKMEFSPIRTKNLSIKNSGKLIIQKNGSEKSFDNFTKNEKIKIDDFQFRSELGRGYYSVVFLATHKKLEMVFAIKIIFKEAINTQILRENIFRELKIHSYVKNPNLISLYKILEDQKYIYMIMQYAIGGTLYSLIKKQKRLPQEKCSKILRDICRGLKYLHDSDIIHRDLKLQNIMLVQGIAKIGDFGCAVHSVCMRKSNIGSPAYLSPQQLNHNYYGKKIDIWSLGIMTYQMLFEATPFDKQIVDALNNGQLNNDMKVKFPIQIQISPQAKDFITKCLTKKQISRMNIDQVLNHPFLNLVPQNIYTPHVRP